MSASFNPHRRRLLQTLAFLLASQEKTHAAFPALEAYERNTGGHVGVYAQNLKSGASLAWRAQERFVMCSTFKASLAGLVLHRSDLGQMNLDGRIAYEQSDLLDYAPVAKAHLAEGSLSTRDMCAAAVELSDNTCANRLLAAVGGPSALTAFWRDLGDPQSRLDHAEPELNRTPAGGIEDTTTPEAMATTLRHLLLRNALKPASRRLLNRWMENCQTGSRRLRGGLPPGWTIANKTGNNGRDAAGDIAMLWSPDGVPTVVGVYTRGGNPGDDAFAPLFAAIAGMACAL